MKDISKCPGTDCPRKEECLRFTMPERVKFQSWIFMKVSIPDPTKCRFFWPKE